MTFDRKVADKPAAAIKSEVSRHQARPVNPQHLRRIIETSDSRVLRKVLIELCQMSPALSGAVTRGLARYSTFAQGVIKGGRVMPQQPVAGPSIANDSDDAYEHMKRRFVTKTPTSQRSTQYPVHGHNSLGRHAAQAHRPPQSTPQVKREYRAPSNDSDADSDAIHMPGSFPRSAQRATNSRSALQDFTTTSPVGNRLAGPPYISGRTTSIKRESPVKTLAKTKAKKCSQCHREFEDEFDVCVYHTGGKVTRGDGATAYSCCKELIGAPGCQFGTHLSEAESDTEPLQRKRPSASPLPDTLQQKRSRVF